MLMGMLSKRHRKSSAGFTLTELLVVVTLIVAMLMILLPALQAFQRGRIEQAANSQLVADLNNARHQAMLNGSPVYMVFFPKWSHLQARTAWEYANNIKYTFPGRWGLPATWTHKDVVKKHYQELTGHLSSSIVPNRLLSGQLTSYALYAESSAGDQPTYDGSLQSVSNKVYLSPWKQLPKGTFFTTNQMQKLRRMNDFVEQGIPPRPGLPSPDYDPDGRDTSDESGKRYPAPRPRGLDMEYGAGSGDLLSLDLRLPYIGFGPRGQLIGVRSGLAIPIYTAPIFTGNLGINNEGDGAFSLEIATGSVLSPPKVTPPSSTVPYALGDVDDEEENKGFSRYNRIQSNMLNGRSESNICNVYWLRHYFNSKVIRTPRLARIDDNTMKLLLMELILIRDGDNIDKWKWSDVIPLQEQVDVLLKSKARIFRPCGHLHTALEYEIVNLIGDKFHGDKTSALLLADVSSEQAQMFEDLLLKRLRAKYSITREQLGWELRFK
jgi:type II secretory pathway pseudopilin PulG